MNAEGDRERLSTDASRLEGEVGTHAHHPQLHFRFFEQLKQRNVFRVAVLYLVVCWLILDPVHVVFHMMEIPAWANRLVIMLMALGFPAVLIFAWVYEITPEGLKLTVEVPHGQSIRKLTGRRLDRAIIAVLAVALTYFVLDKFWISKHLAETNPVAPTAQATPQSSAAPPAVFAPPPHSIAVLPFVNLSGDKEQEYFSDGLTEELLNSLSRINELQVAGRTSSFYFKGEHVDLATIAHKLNVAAVLEGSVRRSAHTVRISAQLTNAVTGFHLWAETYDRELGDVLKLQTEIANAVASALKITLFGDTAARIELGGTRNPAAFDAYLRGTKARNNYHRVQDLQASSAAYTEAIRLDPNYALAFAGRSFALSSIAGEFASGADAEKDFAAAHADAQKAIALAPGMAEGHVALAAFFEGTLDFTRATAEYEHALTLGPGNARALQASGPFFVYMGRADAGIAAARHAVLLDPLSPQSHFSLGLALFHAHRYEEAVAASGEVVSLDPDSARGYASRGIAYLALGNPQAAQASCEVTAEFWANQWCLALAEDKLGRHADAEAALARLKAMQGEGAAYQYATIYAQWGNTDEALKWLETALRLRDAGLEWLKTDPRLDPLRKEPRFQAIERALKFPD